MTSPTQFVARQFTREHARLWRREPDHRGVAVALFFSRAGVALLPLIQLRLGSQLTASDALLAVGFLCWAAVVIWRESARTVVIPFVVVAGLITAALCDVSLYNAADASSSMANALKVCFSLFVVGSVIACSVAIGYDFAGLTWAYCIGAAVAGMSAVFRIGGPTAVYQAGDNTRLAGLAGNPVGLAISAGVAIAMLLHLHASTRLGLVVQLVLVAVNVSGIVVAVGLTGAVVAAVGTAVGQLYVPNAASAVRRASVICVAAIVLIFANYRWNIFGTLTARLAGALHPTQAISTTAGSSGSTLSLRFYTWEVSMERISQHPWAGNGFDDAGQIAYGTVDTHNYFLLSWQTGGVLMVGIAFVLLVLSLVAAVRLWKLRRWFPVPYVVAGLAATWPGAMTSPALYGRSLYFIIALAVSAAFLGQTFREQAASPGAALEVARSLPTR